MSSDTPRAAAATPSALPPGTRLGEFELLKVLGVGGFGIVYLAFDHALEREVAVKEYMPASLAGRTETMHVSLRSQSDSDTFALGLRSFVNEARMLAKFDHPSLLKVHRFWEANGTAYMAMPVISGRTIKDIRAGMAQPPDEIWLRELLIPLLGAIERLHSDGVYHRDIAPDNIVIEPDGRPVLLDFGAARRVISDKSQALTAILKPAYAPIEQYAEAGSVKQGPWTDIYALGATIHYMLLGRPPSPATARAIHDSQAPLSGQTLVGCSENFLHIVDWMLAPRPGDRPQSVAALREVLDGVVPPPVRRATPVEPQGDWERTQVFPTSTVAQTQPMVSDDPGTVIIPRTAVPGPQSIAPTEVQTALQTIRQTVATPVPPVPAPPVAPPPAPAQPAAAAPPAASSGSSKLVPILVGAVVVIAGAAYALWPKPAPAPQASAPAPAPAVVAAAPSPPVTVPASAVTPAVVVAPAAAPVVARADAPASAAVAKPPHTPDARPVGKATTNNKTVPVPAPPPVARSEPPVEPPRTPAPEPVKPPPAPVVAVAPEPTPAKIVGPKEACGKRVLVALWLCIEQQCAKPELTHHPECVKWRAEQAQKANPTN